MIPARLARGPLFYGWVVLVAAFVPNLVYPAVHFSFGTYFESLSREFGADRGTVSLVFSLTPLLYFGLGAITGPLTDRFGPRLLCGAGALLYLVGLVLASRATAIWQVYLTYSLFVGGAVGASYVPSLSTVQRWFVRRRALAAGLVASGSGVGTVVGPAFSTWLIQAQGWRTAYFISGILAAALVGLAAWFLVRSPAEVGLAPDGDPPPAGRSTEPGGVSPPVEGSAVPGGNPPVSRPASAPAGNPPGTGPISAVGQGDSGDLTVREAIRTRVFIWLYIAQGFTTLPLYIGLVHLVPFARDAGLDPDTAALGLGAIGVGSTVGRLGLGSFADRWGRRRSYAVTMAATAALMLAWLILPAGQVPALLIFGFAFGTVYGGFVALSPVVMPDYFGTSYVSGLIGAFYTAAGIGGLIGPWLAGGIFDRTGIYQPAILFGAATAAIGALLTARLPDPAEARQSYPRTPG